MTRDVDRELRIVEAALGLAEGERAAHIANACGDDDALRARVEDLLARLERGDPSAAVFEKLLPGLEAAAARVGDGESGGTVAVSGGMASDSAWKQFLERLQSRGPTHTRYVLKGEIARGGMGVILRVHDQDVQRNLAMKVVLGQGDAEPSGKTPSVDDRTLGRFLEEAQVTGQLDHPGIVPVHDIGVDAEGRVYFTMKLVKGEDFRSVIEKVHAGDREWSLPRALSVIQRVCEAMSYAHAKGVIHRDLKPGNVMVGRFGEVYVMDWGLARVLGKAETKDIRLRAEPRTSESLLRSERRSAASDTPDDALLTMDGDVVGTPAYMPPEQAEGRLDKLGPQADVYAVGAMLYHLLVGHMPYVTPGAQVSNRTILARVLDGPPKTLGDVAKMVPPELAAICEKAMARNSAARYPNMQALADDVRAFLENRVVRAHRSGALAELRSWVRRNRAFASAAAVAIVGIAAGLVVSVVFYHESKQAAGVIGHLLDNARLERDATNDALHRAEALRLAAQANGEISSNPTLALLLAIEAASRERDALTDAALQHALAALTEERVAGLPALAPLESTGERMHDIRFLAFDATGERLMCGGQHFAGILDLSTWQWTTSRDLGEATACAGGFFQEGPRILVALAPVLATPWASEWKTADRWLAHGPQIIDPTTGVTIAVAPPILPDSEGCPWGTVGAAFDPYGSRVACAFGKHGIIADARHSSLPVRFTIREFNGVSAYEKPRPQVVWLSSSNAFVVNLFDSLSVVSAETGLVRDVFPSPPWDSVKHGDPMAWVHAIAPGPNNSILLLDTSEVLRALDSQSGVESWRRPLRARDSQSGVDLYNQSFNPYPEDGYKALTTSEDGRIYSVGRDRIAINAVSGVGPIEELHGESYRPPIAVSVAGRRLAVADWRTVVLLQLPGENPYRVPRADLAAQRELLPATNSIWPRFDYHSRNGLSDDTMRRIDCIRAAIGNDWSGTSYWEPTTSEYHAVFRDKSGAWQFWNVERQEKVLHIPAASFRDATPIRSQNNARVALRHEGLESITFNVWDVKSGREQCEIQVEAANTKSHLETKGRALVDANFDGMGTAFFVCRPVILSAADPQSVLVDLVLERYDLETGAITLSRTLPAAMAVTGWDRTGKSSIQAIGDRYDCILVHEVVRDGSECIHLVRTADLECVLDIRDPDGLGSSWSLSEDNRYVLAWSQENVRVYSGQTGDRERTFEIKHPLFAAIGRDGSSVVIVPYEGPVEHWPIDLLGEARHRAPRTLTDHERERFAVPNEAR